MARPESVSLPQDLVGLPLAEIAALAEGEPTGHLRVSLPGNFGAAWLGPAIAEFLVHHPRVTVEADASNRFVNIVDERFDLAIRLGTLADSGLVARKIADRRRLLCASPAYLAARGLPHSPADLTAHACLFSTAHAHPGRWSFQRDGEPAMTVVVAPRFASSNADLLVHSARAGIGVLYTSDWYVAPDLASGKLIEVLPDFPVAEQGGVFIVTPAARGTPPKTRAFSDWVAAYLQKAPWRSVPAPRPVSHRS